MSVDLRPYQRDAINAVLEAKEREREVVAA